MTDYDAKIRNRLKRVEGQIKGILRMMDEQKECKDVVTQLTAARSAIDRTIGVIVSSNLIDCIQQTDGEEPKTQEEIVQEAVDLLVKSR
ncbi:metal-sensitive transcriptional regulator [Savagea sp. SN6]|uniref:Metal-sensitive transcriptional regulator n=1 Tax=Savagea serpentis TaxID=2785297 RepID=A0A8J7KTG3_9BACL|nr:metal-sensitive transcriptional regulator [Savagea serpentis]MBF4501534.1 metal-sensitive transcriptional regulator [Savagea serpentis]